MSKKNKRLNLKKFIPFCLVVILVIAAAAVFVPKLFKPRCEHVFGEDGFCTLCGKECAHKFSEGYCTICGKVDPDFVFPDEIHSISIVCGGDVMAHVDNLRSASNHDGEEYSHGSANSYYYSDGTFDFNDNYQYVKPYIEEADLALINIETTFSTGGPDYSGYWGAFCAPDSLAEAVKNAGFDVAFTCNNHSLDYGGTDGLIRTVKVLRDNGLTVVGSRAETTENRASVIEVGGINVGLVAATYETAMEGSGHSLNGGYMSETAAEYLNSFRYTAGDGGYVVCDEDKKAIAEQIDWCRENGADVVICYFHWDSTNEYVLNVTNLQRDLAHFAAECGADIIFGSHPHRVQELEVIDIKNADGSSREVPVYYSLGNFISNQRYETMDGDPADDPYASEQELLARVEITVNKTQGTVSIDKLSGIPLYVDKFSGGMYPEYRIYPCVGTMPSYPELDSSGNAWRAQKARETISGILGEKYICE